MFLLFLSIYMLALIMAVLWFGLRYFYECRKERLREYDRECMVKSLRENREVRDV
jgi:preprotein translocase subunit YajC